MPRFRKKPVVIEARQFVSADPDNMTNLVNWMREYPAVFPDALPWHDSRQILVPTLEGTMSASIGDWIIKGIRGEFYPCKPDIFEATYELVP